LTEVLPPADDRVDGELGGIAGDPDRHPPLIGHQVIDAVGDRVPELLVLEVVAANLDRLALGLELPANRLEITDQLTLLGIDADHRLTRGNRLCDRPRDVLKLRVTIRVLGALPGLLVRLQAVTLGLQQPQHRAIDHVVTHLPQRLRQLRPALRRPPQRRLRVTTRGRIHQPLEILLEPRLALQDRPAPRMAAQLPRSRPLLRIQVRKTAQHRRFRDPRRSDHRGQSTITSRPRLRRRPQPTSALIHHPLRAQQPVPLSNRTLIDHNPQF
jgi:hypothetical protein